MNAVALGSLVCVVALVGCTGDGSDGIAVDSAGPVEGVTVSQSGAQLVVRWEQTADSGSCTVDYVLDSGETGSRSFGALTAVPVVEQVFDVPGSVVSATLTCT